MQVEEMARLVDIHVKAEDAGDIAEAVSVYTADIEHDVVGAPGGALHGVEAATGRYEQLLAEMEPGELRALRTYHGEDFYVIEHECSCRVVGQFVGVEGHGRPVTFRILHIFEFRDGGISRENVWMDTATLVAQLSQPPEGPVPD